MTTTPPPSIPLPPRRLAAVLSTLSALAIVVAVVVFMDWQRGSVLPSPLQPDVSMRYQAQPESATQPENSSGPANPPRHWSHEGMLQNWLAQRPGDAVLATEPAGLPAYPGGQRVMSVKRQAAGMVEEISCWRIPQADSPAVRDFYAAAAQNAGFTPQGGPQSQSAPPASPPVRGPDLRGSAFRGRGFNAIFLRPRPPSPLGEETLVVHVRPTHDHGVRIVLWLRYPMDMNTGQ